MSAKTQNKPLLIYCSHTLQLNRDGCGQGTDLYGSSTGLIVFKVFRVNFIVDRKIVFHVRQENGYINDLVPAAACIFENIFHILENAAALFLDIVRLDFTICIERYAGNYFCAFFTRTDAGKKKQIADTFRMRVKSDGLRSFGRVDGLF